MLSFLASTQHTVLRQVFPSWSIEIPSSFAETFVDEGDDYWHAYDEHRSVSLTSVVITEKGRPVSPERIARQIPPPDGMPVDELPPGLRGWGVIAPAIHPARASRLISGALAAEGRLLIVTITSDDLDWGKQTWLSIRHHPAWPPTHRRRQAKKARTRRRR